MKIYRGPQSTGNWQETDGKSIDKNWTKNWRPGHKLRFDLTIDKRGERHTNLLVEVEEQDILDLHDGLVNYQRRRIEELEQDLELAKQRHRQLEDALRKISSLATDKKDRAPNTDELLEAVEEAADHFVRSSEDWRFREEKPFKSRFPWVKWKSL